MGNKSLGWDSKYASTRQELTDSGGPDYPFDR